MMPLLGQCGALKRLRIGELGLEEVGRAFDGGGGTLSALRNWRVDGLDPDLDESDAMISFRAASNAMPNIFRISLSVDGIGDAEGTALNAMVRALGAVLDERAWQALREVDIDWRDYAGRPDHAAVEALRGSCARRGIVCTCLD